MEPTLIGYIYMYYFGLNVLAFSLREFLAGQSHCGLMRGQSCTDSMMLRNGNHGSSFFFYVIACLRMAGCFTSTEIWGQFMCARAET